MFNDEYDDNKSKIEYFINSYIKLNNYVIEKQIKVIFFIQRF